MKLNETYQGKVKFDYNFAEGTTGGAEYTGPPTLTHVQEKILGESTEVEGNILFTQQNINVDSHLNPQNKRLLIFSKSRNI